jgi:glutamine synthetase
VSAFWAVENPEAALRYVGSSEFLGDGQANIELKASDASSSPYLSLARLIAAGSRDSRRVFGWGLAAIRLPLNAEAVESVA